MNETGTPYVEGEVLPPGMILPRMDREGVVLRCIGNLRTILWNNQNVSGGGVITTFGYVEKRDLVDVAVFIAEFPEGYPFHDLMSAFIKACDQYAGEKRRFETIHGSRKKQRKDIVERKTNTRRAILIMGLSAGLSLLDMCSNKRLHQASQEHPPAATQIKK